MSENKIEKDFLRLLLSVLNMGDGGTRVLADFPEESCERKFFNLLGPDMQKGVVDFLRFEENKSLLSSDNSAAIIAGLYKLGGDYLECFYVLVSLF